jgi:hypothetical protein
MPWSTCFWQAACCSKYSCSLDSENNTEEKIRVKYYVVAPSESVRMGAKHNSFSHEIVRKPKPKMKTVFEHLTDVGARIVFSSFPSFINRNQ